MSKWDKLLARICSLSKDMRFSELQKVLESYGYEMQAPKGGSSHYTEKLSLEEVANQVGFSREYFCRFFKQHMGITFLRYLNEVRISHAGRILMNTDKSISEVMQESGFTNQTIFNRLFKEIYGMTPRQARNSYAENTYS